MPVSISQGGLQFEASISMQQFQQQLNSIEKQLHGLTTTAQKEANAIENVVKQAAGAMAAYATFSAASSFVSDIIQVRSEFQKIQAVLTNSLGSSSEAERSLKMISDYASTTPFQLNELSNAYVKLVNQGFKPTKQELIALGDLAASTGKGFDQLAEAIIDAQAGEFERLKEFGIRAQKEGDRVAFTFKGVKTEVGFTADAIRNYITGLGNLEGVTGATVAISKTLGGQISNLKDSWERLLNTAGQASEGAFSASISALNTLIVHYQDVLKVLGILVVTYGSYKAAVIATNAITAISTSLTQGYTLAETLRYRALLISEGAMKLLNRTMLANPAVAIATGITALTVAFIAFRQETNLVRTSQELLAEAENKVGDGLVEAEAKFRPYLEQLKNTNLSEEDRLRIYNELLKIDPKILEGINAKTLSYDSLAKNVKIYTDELRKQFQVEGNREAIQLSIKQENLLKERLKAAKARAAELKTLNESNTLSGFSQGGALQTNRGQAAAENNVRSLTSQLEQQQKVTEELVDANIKLQSAGKGTAEAVKRTVEVIDKEIAGQQKLQKEVSTTSVQWQEYQKRIEALQRERESITGPTQKALKAQQTEENKINDILRQRADILQSLKDLQRESAQSGMLKEESEIDRVNAKYDAAIRNVVEFNKKVAEFNKNNKASVPGIAITDINELNKARNQQISNTIAKQDAENYKKNLEVQKDIFTRYETAKAEIGIEKANQMYADQTKGFQSYITFLEGEASRLAMPISAGIGNIGDQLKFDQVTKELAEAQKRAAEADFKQRVDDYARLLNTTANFQRQRLQMESQYEKDLSILRKEFSGKDLKDREKALKEAKDADLRSLAENIAGQGQAWRTLNQQIVGFTRDRIRQEIALLDKMLKAGTLPKDKQDALKALIKEWKQLDDAIEDTNLEKIGGHLKQLGGWAKFGADQAGQLSEAFRGVNDEVAEALQSLSDVGQLAGTALTGIGQFMSGDIAGGITSTIALVTGIFSMIKRSKQEVEDSKRRMFEFQQGVFIGETEINALYRQRTLEQIRLNKLRVQGIKDEQQLLQQQQKEVEKDAAVVLAELQKQFAKVQKEISIGAGQTMTVLTLESLAGKSFEQLEELFIKGQLTDSAKELFQQLQKLKQEGVDIDRQLQELQKEAQQIFTGTTVDALTDSITEMFKAGKVSAADFADFFQERMGDAALSVFKNEAIAKAMQQFYDEFAAAAQSDNQLTRDEITKLEQSFMQRSEELRDRWEAMQQITGMTGLGGISDGSVNTYKAAIKGITEGQAELLAGQFGGLRMTALDQLSVARRSVELHQQIEFNTANTVAELKNQTNVMITYFRDFGIKLK